MLWRGKHVYYTGEVCYGGESMYTTLVKYNMPAKDILLYYARKSIYYAMRSVYARRSVYYAGGIIYNGK
jgi:hypothetical protein